MVPLFVQKLVTAALDNNGCGLVFKKKRIQWGFNHGHLKWAPVWVKDAIVKTYVPISCFLFGHEIVGPLERTTQDGTVFRFSGFCPFCGKEFQ